MLVLGIQESCSQPKIRTFALRFTAVPRESGRGILDCEGGPVGLQHDGGWGQGAAERARYGGGIPESTGNQAPVRRCGPESDFQLCTSSVRRHSAVATPLQDPPMVELHGHT